MSTADSAPRAHLFGVSAALVTPFAADGSVDGAAVQAHVADLIARGIDGVTLFAIEAIKLENNDQSVLIKLDFHQMSCTDEVALDAGHRKADKNLSDSILIHDSLISDRRTISVNPYKPRERWVATFGRRGQAPWMPTPVYMSLQGGLHGRIRNILLQENSLSIAKKYDLVIPTFFFITMGCAILFS